ncbi:MAG TPA: hypothetical protein VF624_11640 [Tepidisphaeraceae bacterium]|jgi:hypothetical protein
MNEGKPVVRSWMQSNGWDLVRLEVGRRCSGCPGRADDLAYVAFDGEREFYLCLDCADSRYHGDEKVGILPAAAVIAAAELEEAVERAPEPVQADEFEDEQQLRAGLAEACNALRLPEWHASPARAGVEWAVREACRAVTAPKYDWRSKLEDEAADFLDLLERCLWHLPHHVALPYYLELLGAGFGCAISERWPRQSRKRDDYCGKPLVVQRAAEALIAMEPTLLLPELSETASQGTAGFESSGALRSFYSEAPDYRSWNAAVLLARLHQLTGSLLPADTIETLCAIMTYVPADKESESCSWYPFDEYMRWVLRGLPQDPVASALTQRLDRLCPTYRQEETVRELRWLAEAGSGVAIDALLGIIRDTSPGDDPVYYEADQCSSLATPGMRRRLFEAMGGDDRKWVHYLDGWLDERTPVPEATGVMAEMLATGGGQGTSDALRWLVTAVPRVLVELRRHPDREVRLALVDYLIAGWYIDENPLVEESLNDLKEDPDEEVRTRARSGDEAS